MNETAKLADVRRNRGDYGLFLAGHGIDVGCGPDPLRVQRGQVDAWDVQQGDGQKLKGVPDGKYDFVYSSHCLEHLADPVDGLRNWLRVTRPGGHLYIVVPDYVRYEGCHWPSRKNSTHRSSFSLEVTRQQTRRPNHWHIEHDLRPAIVSMGGDLIRVLLEDDGLDYNIGLEKDQTRGHAAAQINLVIAKPIPAKS